MTLNEAINFTESSADVRHPPLKAIATEPNVEANAPTASIISLNIFVLTSNPLPSGIFVKASATLSTSPIIVDITSAKSFMLLEISMPSIATIANEISGAIIAPTPANANDTKPSVFKPSTMFTAPIFSRSLAMSGIDLASASTVQANVTIPALITSQRVNKAPNATSIKTDTNTSAIAIATMPRILIALITLPASILPATSPNTPPNLIMSLATEPKPSKPRFISGDNNARTPSATKPIIIKPVSSATTAMSASTTIATPILVLSIFAATPPNTPPNLIMLLATEPKPSKPRFISGDNNARTPSAAKPIIIEPVSNATIDTRTSTAIATPIFPLSTFAATSPNTPPNLIM